MNVVPISPAPNAWRRDLICDDKNRPRRMVANVTCMLTRAPEWRGVLAYDDFAERISAVKPPPWHDEVGKPGPWTEQDDVRLVHHVEREMGFSLRPGEVHSSAENTARRACVNPVTSWLSSLEWDTTHRIDHWLTRYLGVVPSSYTADVGRWFLLGAVARAFRAGSKVDHVLVLEGAQGKRKSSALRALAGDDFFNDSPIDLASKDRFVALQGTWIYEIAELDGFDRSDVNRIKSYVTSQVDIFRPPYGRSSVRMPRRCVFAATVNGDTYLRDETGNRRFWPVPCGEILVEELRRDRDLLWAEAVFKFKAEATWWPDSAEKALACAQEQGGRVQRDAWQDVVEDYVHGKLTGRSRDEITVADVLRDALSMPAGKWSQPDQNRVARVLRLMGWERVQVRQEGSRSWVYRPKENGVSPVQLPLSPVRGATGDTVKPN